MTCALCKGIYQNGYTTFVAKINDSVIIIKNVPCIKCDQCGEVSYKGDVYERIEQIVEKQKNYMSEVAIIKYTNTAA